MRDRTLTATGVIDAARKTAKVPDWQTARRVENQR
jgi:hypothetical protein